MKYYNAATNLTFSCANRKPLYANHGLKSHEQPTFDHWYSADTPARATVSQRRTMTFAIGERTLGNSRRLHGARDWDGSSPSLRLPQDSPSSPSSTPTTPSSDTPLTFLSGSTSAAVTYSRNINHRRDIGTTIDHWYF